MSYSPLQAALLCWQLLQPHQVAALNDTAAPVIAELEELTAELKTIAANTPKGDSTTGNPQVTPLTTRVVMNAKNADGTLNSNAWPIYVLSEDENVKVTGTTPASGYTDKVNASIYYLVAKTAEPERGNTLESIESTLD